MVWSVVLPGDAGVALGNFTCKVGYVEGFYIVLDGDLKEMTCRRPIYEL